MNNHKYILISDTIHGTIKLNQLEKEVISTQIFNRLHNVSQNSTVYLTFPTNRTKRFEHSVGTMWLCGKIFQESITNSDDTTVVNFFTNIQSIIDKVIDSIVNQKNNSYSIKYRGKIGDRNLKKESLNRYKDMDIPTEYNSFIPRNVPDKFISTYAILFQAVRLSGLLHDVGHPPFSHITEFALKDIWNDINKIDESVRTGRQKNFIKCMETYFTTTQDLHEQIGNRITSKVLDEIVVNMTSNLERNQNYIFSQLFKIIVGEVTSAILQEKHKAFGEVHRIIDGSLDGDRLDYVNRDPANSGLNVGTIEYDRMISGMRLSEMNGCFIFTPSTKIVDSIDDFFNRRWKMYKQIIYHHRVVKTDYLLQDCIKQLALTYLEKDDIDEDCTNILPYNISGLWKAIQDKASYQDYFDTLIQWDDGWILTIMKVHYFSEYSNMEVPTNLCYKLEELLANKKNYFSLIKRMEDYVKIDRSIANIFFQEYNKIDDLINIIKSDNENSTIEEKQVVVPMDPTLNYIKKFTEEVSSKNYKSITRESFFLNYINKIFSNFFEKDWLSNIVNISINEICTECDDIKDAFAVIKKVKTGIPGGKAIDGGLGLYTINSNGVSIEDYNDLSNVSTVLQNEVDYMPAFFIYILKANEDLDYNKIKELIGERIANKILERITERLNQFTN